MVNLSFEQIVKFILGLLVLIAPIVTFIRTGSIKKSLKEIDNIVKYKNENLDTSTYTQSFDRMVDDWQFSEEKDAPILIGKKDIQAYIQSFADTALDKILDKFLTGGLQVPVTRVQEEDGINDIDYTREPMLTYAELLDKAEEYRERYKLSDELNALDVFKFVEENSKKLQKSVGDVILRKDSKGGNDEKKDV